jgi:hypothetical protein
MFVVKNKGLFMENSELCNIKTRYNSILYQPPSHRIYQEGPYYISINVYNNVTAQTQVLSCNFKFSLV